jgi:hypothetical protein
MIEDRNGFKLSKKYEKIQVKHAFTGKEKLYYLT